MQNQYQIDFQQIDNFKEMNLFNLSEYEISGTTYFIPNFLQILNRKNFKKEIILNPEKIEFLIANSLTLENLF
jgi:hypothetical protein